MSQEHTQDHSFYEAVNRKDVIRDHLIYLTILNLHEIKNDMKLREPGHQILKTLDRLDFFIHCLVNNINFSEYEEVGINHPSHVGHFVKPGDITIPVCCINTVSGLVERSIGRWGDDERVIVWRKKSISKDNSALLTTNSSRNY